MTSWRTAILMALAVYIVYVGITYVFNLVSLLTQIDENTVGYETPLVIYSLCIFAFLGLGGAAFGIGLNSAIRGNKVKQVVFILVIVALSCYAVFEIFMGVSSLVDMINSAKNYPPEVYGNFYSRMIPSRIIGLIYTIIVSFALLFLAVFANKKFAKKEPFQQY